jgi:hypothetical protein
MLNCVRLLWELGHLALRGERLAKQRPYIGRIITNHDARQYTKMAALELRTAIV